MLRFFLFSSLLFPFSITTVAAQAQHLTGEKALSKMMEFAREGKSSAYAEFPHSRDSWCQVQTRSGNGVCGVYDVSLPICDDLFKLGQATIFKELTLDEFLHQMKFYGTTGSGNSHSPECDIKE